MQQETIACNPAGIQLINFLRSAVINAEFGERSERMRRIEVENENSKLRIKIIELQRAIDQLKMDKLKSEK